jgi:hypothetical protein
MLNPASLAGAQKWASSVAFTGSYTIQDTADPAGIIPQACNASSYHGSMHASHVTVMPLHNSSSHTWGNSEDTCSKTRPEGLRIHEFTIPH